MQKSRSFATRQRLLTAAAEVIAEQGYAAASLSTVASTLGLTKGAFAYHFPTKSTIAVALREEFNAALLESDLAAREQFKDQPLHALITFLATIGYRLSTDPIVRGSIALTFDLSSPIADAEAIIRELHRLIRNHIYDAAENGFCEPKRHIDEIAEGALALVVGQNFISSRIAHPPGGTRFRTMRILMDVMNAPDGERAVDEVLAALHAGSSRSTAPTFRDRELRLESAAESTDQA